MKIRRNRICQEWPTQPGLKQARLTTETVDPKPWRGFKTRDDFELAEFALDAGLNEGLVNRLFKIISRVCSGESRLTFSSYRDLNDAWSVAEEMEVPVSSSVNCTTAYKSERPSSLRRRPSQSHTSGKPSRTKCFLGTYGSTL